MRGKGVVFVFMYDKINITKKKQILAGRIGFEVRCLQELDYKIVILKS